MAKKTAQQAGTVTHESSCFDSLTKSATVYWTTAPGKLSSKTFRGVPALQEWLNLGPEAVARHWNRLFSKSREQSDYCLPGFDGASALQPAQQFCRGTPFIFLSGVMGDDVAVDSLKSGLDSACPLCLKRLNPLDG